MRLDAVLVPAELRPDRLRGRVAVVIDALRATTTVAVALAAGVRAVWPVASVAAARALARRLGARVPVWLAGERGGLPPPGFDLGNAPAQLAAAGPRLAGRTLVLTTTNGTLALERAWGAGARPVYAAAFVNAGATAAVLAEHLAAGREAVLVCAGSRGRLALEDVLAAGLLAEGVAARVPGLRLTDAARLARTAWLAARREWPAALAGTDHARQLIALGFAADVQLAAQVDRYPVVAVRRRGRLVRGDPAPPATAAGG